MIHIYKSYPPKKKNFLSSISVNTLLMILNIALFFVFTILIYSNQRFLDYIALKPSNILSGKYIWTFLTSMFMHGGFFHLFANMISLLFIGSLAERILGRKRYIGLYLFSGLIAGVFFVLSSLFLSSDLNTYAVGASGALFGLVGLLILLTPNLPVYIMFIPIPVKMKYAGPGILFLLWIISIAGNVPIGNVAHLGGLIAGLAYGFYLKSKFPNKVRKINRYFSI